MTAIDTNILVRYVVPENDPAQARAATRLIDEICSEDEPALVLHMVLAELVWVLDRSLKKPKDAILATLISLSDNAHLAFDTADEFLAAIAYFRDSNIGFADCLIAARAGTLGALPISTFDKDASRLPGFHKLPLEW